MVPGQLSTDNKFSDILRQIIAYSAIDEGTRIFGDTAIRAFYDDANNLGAALLDADVSQNIVAHATDISKSFIQFSGELALSKTLQTEITDAVDGVLTYTDETDNHTLRIDLTDETWLPISDYIPNIQPEVLAGIARTTITHPILEASGDEVAIRGAIEKITGENNTDNIENVVFAVGNSETNNVSLAPTAADKVTLFVGGEGNDTVNAGSVNLLIWGADGDDTLNGSATDDYLFGGSGNDTLNGGEGENVLVGGDGGDILHGGTGQDILIGGAGRDVLYGGGVSEGGYPDVVWGGDGADEFHFSQGDDVLILRGNYLVDQDIINIDLSQIWSDYSWWSDRDVILINPEKEDRIYVDDVELNLTTNQANWVTAPFGYPTLVTSVWHGHTLAPQEPIEPGTYPYVTSGVDYFGGGEDWVSYIEFSAPGTSFLTMTNFGIGDFGLNILYPKFIETVNLIDYAAALAWRPEIDFTGSGADVKGTDGNDVLAGSEADEVIFGGMGDDVLFATGGNDILDGGLREDTVSFVFESTGVYADLYNNTATKGGGGIDTFVDVENITGTSYNDVIIGDDGDNLIEGGSGNDTLDGGGGIDFVSYQSSVSSVTINLITGAAHNDNDTDTITNFENIIGSSYDDVIIGNGTDNIIEGGAGSDVIDGGGGMDTISYVSSAYSVTVNLIIETESDGVSTDSIANFENIIGSAYDDILIGNASNNIIEGGAGSDMLDGGAGIDTISFAKNSSGVVTNLSMNSATDGNNDTDTIINFENIIGSSYDDVLTGDATDNIIEGGTGSDTIDGGAGLDTVSYKSALFGVTIDLFGSTYKSADGTFDSLYNIEKAIGSSQADYIYGNSGANVLEGGGGDDRIYAGSGDDVLKGGAGDDILIGDLGNDTIDGGAGTDFVNYSRASSGVAVNLATGTATGQGTDSLSNVENIIGTPYADTIFGDNADNVIAGGGGGADILDGSAGIDTVDYSYSASAVTVNLTNGIATGDDPDTISNFENVTGSTNDDILIGDNFDNILKGSLGNDIIRGKGGFDYLDGEDGIDTVDYSEATAGAIVNLSLGVAGNDGDGYSDAIYNIENIIGSNYADTIIGDNNGNVLTGNAGNDVIEGGGGDDTIDGGADVDTATYFAFLSAILANLQTGIVTGDGTDTLISIENLSGSAFDDLLIGNGGDNVLDGYLGVDTVSYASAASAVTVNLLTGAATGDGADTLIAIENVLGSIYADTLAGSAVSNLLNGGNGNDTLSGGGGDDALIGGAGNDALNGDAGIDTASFENALAGITADLTAGTASGEGSDTLANIENLTGSSYNDILKGNSSGNVIFGGAGNDNLYGYSGDDILIGGDGNDYLYASYGNDTLIGGYGSDDLRGEYNDNIFYDISSDLNLAFDPSLDGTDIFRGSGSRDTFYLQAGNNTALSGVGGSDTFHVWVPEDGTPGTKNTITVQNAYANETNTVILENLAYTDSWYFTTAHNKGDIAINYDGTSTTSQIVLSLQGISVNTSGGVTWRVDALQFADNVTVNYEDLPFVTLADMTTETLNGTFGNDYLINKGGDDTISAGAGDDYIGSYNGNAVIYLGDGDDDALVGYGNHTVYGGDGNDYAYYHISATGGITFYGEAGNDTAIGGTLADYLYGGDGDDNLNGNLGDDLLDGGIGGNDFLTGNWGNDTLIYGGGLDWITGDAGSDALVLTVSATINDIAFSNYSSSGTKIIIDSGFDEITIINQRGSNQDEKIERIVFADGFETTLNDYQSWINGSSSSDTLNGNAGHNTLIGKAGNDILSGGDGDDALHGGGDNDTLSGGNGNDLIYGGTGNDILYGNNGLDTLNGGVAADTFVFEGSSAFYNVDTIADFNTAEADKIDLHDILDAAFDPLQDAISDFVNFTNSGSNSVMSIDRDGAGSAYSFVDVATLNGVTNLDETTLYNNGNLLAA